MGKSNKRKVTSRSKPPRSRSGFIKLDRQQRANHAALDIRTGQAVTPIGAGCREVSGGAVSTASTKPNTTENVKSVAGELNLLSL